MVALSKALLFLAAPEYLRLGEDRGGPKGAIGAPIGEEGGGLVGEGGLRKISGVVLIRPPIWLETLLKFSSMLFYNWFKQVWHA